jgi:hypothetical protein
MLKKIFTFIGVVAVISVAGSALGGEDTTDANDDTTTVATDSGDNTQVEAVADESAKKDKKKSKPAKAAKPAAVKAMNVQAARLVKEFERNELAADAKYDGKTLRITGRIDKIDTDIWDEDKYILRLGKKWDLIGVNCNDMPTDELATLQQGQTVTVVGNFDDGGDLGVEVANCHLA